MLFLNELLIPAGEQCFRARRIPDFLLKVSNFPRMWILAENASPYFPANRRFITLEKRVDYETSISLHDRLLPRSMHNTTVTDSLRKKFLRKLLEFARFLAAIRRIRTGDLLITNESRGDHHRLRRNNTREKWGFH